MLYLKSLDVVVVQQSESTNNSAAHIAVESAEDSDLEILPNGDGDNGVHRIFEIDDSDENENGVTMTQRIQTKCPISQTPIRSSWKSSSCGHEFDRESIIRYIRTKKGTEGGGVECPILGCTRKLSMSDVEVPQIVMNSLC